VLPEDVGGVEADGKPGDAKKGLAGLEDVDTLVGVEHPERLHEALEALEAPHEVEHDPVVGSARKRLLAPVREPGHGVMEMIRVLRVELRRFDQADGQVLLPHPPRHDARGLGAQVGVRVEQEVDLLVASVWPVIPVPCQQAVQLGAEPAHGGGVRLGDRFPAVGQPGVESFLLAGLELGLAVVRAGGDEPARLGVCPIGEQARATGGDDQRFFCHG